MVSLTSVPHIEMYFGKWIHTFKADMAGSSLFKASGAEIFLTKFKNYNYVYNYKMRMKQTTSVSMHVFTNDMM